MKYLYILVLITIPSALYAGGNGVSAGRILLEPSSARVAALAGAYAAVKDDVSAMATNPGSLGTLSSGQASFLYQKGLADDAYGNIQVGMPTKKGGFGVQASFYNGGTIDHYDGTNTTSVNAKKDMSLALGYATRVNQFSMGVTGKYVSSELVETSKASAFAGDFGLQYDLSSKWTFGAAIQNIGSNMTYVHDSETLPRMARLGVMWSTMISNIKLNTMAEAPYDMNAAAIHPAFGIESIVGPLSLRAGYQAGNELQGVSFGAGFLIGSATIDYSYGLVKDLSAEHRMSVSYKFGGKENPVDFSSNSSTQVQYANPQSIEVK